MAQYKSPKGDRIIEILEYIECKAGITGIDDKGEPIYDTTGSTLDWDGQKPVLRNGKLVYLCENGLAWSFDQLVKAEEEDNA